MWILETANDAADRVTFRIASDSVKTIGRSTAAEFVVDAPLVSRLHCQLTADSDALEVKDLESTNGTFVNGKRVNASPLRSGDTLTVGRIDLRVSQI
jgi:pSer/pThr/pTyr-binding forkhead associated (FHA) protein